MRGTQIRADQFRVHRRIIPAYAGNTGTVRMACCLSRDHPRVCGEHFPRKRGGLLGVGSSPRMRGTPGPRLERLHAHRIIPAYAGNTSQSVSQKHSEQDHPRVCGGHSFSRLALWFFQDHPRVCGEHEEPVQRIPAERGSSPRMRGTRPGCMSSLLVNGIIPAYAGNTKGNFFIDALQEDHPRVCGEHYRSDGEECTELGSSPRMRGTHFAIM